MRSAQPARLQPTGDIRRPPAYYRHHCWGTNPREQEPARAFTSNSWRTSPRPTQIPRQPPDLNPSPSVVRKEVVLQASGPHTSPRVQSISPGSRETRSGHTAPPLCSAGRARWRSALGCPGSATRGPWHSGRSPAPCQDSVLESSGQGSWVQTPALQPGGGHDCPMLDVPGPVTLLPTGNGRCHGALALPAQWAAPRLSHLLGAPWCGLPAHLSKIKHCLNSQYPSLRDGSPGPAEFCPSSHGSGCLPSGPGPSLRCVWPPLLTAPARAHPPSCYRQCLTPNFHQSGRQELSSRSTCGHGGDLAGYSVHPD